MLSKDNSQVIGYALGITALLKNSKCSCTESTFRFFILSRLVLPALATA